MLYWITLMRPDTLGVIGLGAIGGSVAWQAARAGVSRIVGYSPAPAEGVAAAKAGAITEIATSARMVVRQSDFLVLAAPPAAAMDQLRSAAAEIRSRGIWCTDVSSVKGPIVRLAQSLGLAPHFAGSHPLAGTHRSGFDAARSDLFSGVIVYVTPVEQGDAAAREVEDFWSGVLGAHPVPMAAGAHDSLLAWTSHLPQVAASALAVALAASGPRGVTYGTGARDGTRIAASSVEMWRDVLLMNREPVLKALEGLEDSLGTLRHTLLSGDAAALTNWLANAAEWRRGLGE
ncbi:MAG: prephenate dehydrogenase/arogenate dehydrogenase family protein [Gemmatimonadetes bacterium]|nr:prephenate dehydrogenase/arogenate dehydrogenase family protein [Gemmatimonadota bacterium]